MRGGRDLPGEKQAGREVGRWQVFTEESPIGGEKRKSTLWRAGSTTNSVVEKKKLIIIKKSGQPRGKASVFSIREAPANQ